jgi:hypothetical protein
MSLAVKIIGGYVGAAILTYDIRAESDSERLVRAGAWRRRRGPNVDGGLDHGPRACPSLWTWVRHPTFPKPKTVFMVIVDGLLFWMLLAPEGFLSLVGCPHEALKNVV